MAEAFAERLRRLREHRGATIAALADEVGVSEGTIRQLEKGGVTNPGFVVGLRLAHALGVDPYYLALGEGSSLGERIMLLERRVATLEKWMRSPRPRG